MNANNPLSSIRGQLPVIAVFAALLLVPPLFFDPSTTYLSRRFITVIIFAIFAMALNIIFGETDQLILYMGGIAALGTYTTVLTAEHFAVSPWLTLFVGAFVSGVFGALICYVAARRQFTVIVLAIVTFAFQMIIMEVIVGLRDITGGTTGIPFRDLDLPAVESMLGIGAFALQFYVLVGIFAAVFALYTWLTNSKYGLAFAAIRQDEFAARATGIDAIRLKVFAGFISTFIIGFVGPFYAQTTGIVIPGLFSFNGVDVLVLIILVLGGLRSRFGPLVGAAIVIYLDNLLSQFGQWRTVTFGLLLTFLFIYFQDGVLPMAQTMYEERGIRDRLAGLRSGE